MMADNTSEFWHWHRETDKERLLSALRALFGHKAWIFPSPALTGKHLWKLTRNAADYTPMDDSQQRLFRETSIGQGRIEMCAPKGITEVPALYLYDIRFAYGALCQHLPTGPAVFREGDCYAPRLHGRYQVRYVVPDGWDHLGIFMTKRPKGPGWAYPSAPNTVHTTWAQGCEIALARHFGWYVEVLRGVVFPNPDKLMRPLDAWQSKLLRLWREDARLRSYARDILIQTIGSFHQGNGKVVKKTAPFGTDLNTLPAHNPTLYVNDDNEWEWREEEAAGRWQRDFSHPEWTAEIWARCRCRLLSYEYRKDSRPERIGLLHIPRSQIIAIRADAAFLTAPSLPDYIDEPGLWRLAAERQGPFDLPEDARRLRSLVHEGGRVYE